MSDKTETKLPEQAPEVPEKRSKPEIDESVQPPAKKVKKDSKKSSKKTEDKSKAPKYFYPIKAVPGVHIALATFIDSEGKKEKGWQLLWLEPELRTSERWLAYMEPEEGEDTMVTLEYLWLTTHEENPDNPSENIDIDLNGMFAARSIDPEDGTAIDQFCRIVKPPVANRTPEIMEELKDFINFFLDLPNQPEEKPEE
eukprot:gnl/Dysnectes_brevis/1797_a2059_1903.p1 GENE.gnl/Dysnectes_brevis/1797_a2059_1903~~gnl/Dysnectes_brevis/1797_a2059_1903.p1  ORF type:complete len:210 (+),score=47.45 gnl/Dysnectes_brevis/1797_a2059_1903:38-631(+)